MKSPFKKLRDFALSKQGLKEKTFLSPGAYAEESQDVTKGMQDVQNMRAQYEGLMMCSQTISGAAYDFSRSLQDMALYMVETFGQIRDGEIGSIFGMLGKVQFEISKLLDLYAAHISQTISAPTEMMISELQQVEVMKEQYDKKRQLYNLIQKEKPKGKTTNKKGDHFDHHSALIKDDFEEQANILGVRLQSLKHGRSLSLITQAARYHNAQMHLFSKGLASIKALEPVMKQVSLERNIDRTLADEGGGIRGHINAYEVDGGDMLEMATDSESLASSPRQFLEIQLNAAETLMKLDESSKSAPISASMYYQNGGHESIQELSLDKKTQKKVSKYALPSPSDTDGRWIAHTTDTVSSQLHTSATGLGSKLRSAKNDVHPWEEAEKTESYKSDLGGAHNSQASHVVKRPLFVGERREFSKIQSPLTAVEHNVQIQQSSNHQRKDSVEGRCVMFTELTNDGGLKSPMIGKRYSHSGPLTAKHSRNSTYTIVNNESSVPFGTHNSPLFKSGPLSKSPMPVNIRPLISQSVSPPILSPPRISELHKLPPLPAGFTTPPKSASPIAHSAPLGKKVQGVPFVSGPASPLPPPPPGLVTRSLSIPSAANRAQTKKDY